MPEGVNMFDRATRSLQEALQFAFHAASEEPDRLLDTKHLLKGLARAHGIARRAMLRLGISDALKAEDECPASDSIAQRVSQLLFTTQSVPFSQRVRETIAAAEQEASGLGHEYLGTDHVLLAMIARHEADVSGLLSVRGVSEDALRATVLDIQGQTREE
jgi:ATP-dependent Clp protease ATP-binding subunit ClpA